MSMNDFQFNNQNHEDTHMELRAEGLVKRYGKRTVVNDVSINVRQGEIVGLPVVVRWEGKLSLIISR